jgi:uncharacterized protein
MKLKNKQILITGANRGIGRAIANALAKEGAHLHLANRTIEAGLENELLSLGAASVKIWPLDMSDRDAIAAFGVAFTIPIDILINNAGQLTGGLVEKQNTKEIYSMFQVNLVGLIHLTACLLPGMIARGTGKIVNNSSVSGVMHFPLASTYSAAKTGLVAFTSSLRQELIGTGVSTLLLLTPGVKTRMFDAIPDLYGANLDTNFLSSISAQDWADDVVAALKDDREILYPRGSGKTTLQIAKHLPSIFEYFVGKKFKR